MWNLRCGRGWGKTKTGAETFISLVRYGGYKHPNLAGATAEDVRDLMIEGESGIMNCAPPDFKPQFIQTTKKLIWPNGVISHVYYGTEPDKSRGPQSDLLWCDEIAKWQFAQETFDNLLMGLRLGDNPLCVITSTPRPTKFLMDLEKRKDPNGRPSCVTTKGRTEDNLQNLAPVFISTVISAYQGTRQGRQELEGEFLDDNPDALWHQGNIDMNRVSVAPPLDYILVGVDPASTSKVGSNDTGIVVVGRGEDGHGYVIADYTIHGTPQEWGEAVVRAFHRHSANFVIAEVNQGGEMVAFTINTIDPGVPVKAIHSSRGKDIRAEPISALYAQNRFHHVGQFRELEDQMTSWIPGEGDSPDRCFVAGTLISTENGDIPIENIKVGMKVLTRCGYKRVVACGLTSENSKTVDVEFSNGKVLTGTGNHPIYIKGKGFIPMDALVHSDEVLTCEENLLCITELPLQDTQILKVNPAAAIITRSSKNVTVRSFTRFIDKCGKMFMGKSQKDVTFTTKTGTSATILLIILNVLPQKNMLRGTETGVPMNRKPTWTGLDRLLRNGTHREKGINGTLNMVREPGKAEKQLREPVYNVAMNTSRNVQEKALNSVPGRVWPNITDKIKSDGLLGYVNTAVKNLKLILGAKQNFVPVYVQSIREGTSQKVYNLTVEDSKEYFANGVLVHNCDALVHAAKELKILSHVKVPRTLAEGTSYASTLDKNNPFSGMDFSLFKDPF
jgi:phage terminase large subunit-like protein